MSTSNNQDDSEIARLLQEDYDREAAVVLDLDDRDEDDTRVAEASRVSSRDKHKPLASSRQSLVPELSPVDPSLELSDPTPDIVLLFQDFNKRYFWGSLTGVEVKWSSRMTSLAGLCVYEGRGGLCSVRLSMPLLKLRPRKNLVEMLLHEMIHAYLFTVDDERDHRVHGPSFHSHMHRINKATGANISVYHNFYDEMEYHQQHWWRCNGPCQQIAPYFGYVKRSMNRAPSANELWWLDHQATCGGVYTKIKEPEGYGQGKRKGKEGTFNSVEPSKDIQAFLEKGHSLSSTTEANNKPGGTSLYEGKSRTQSISAATFSDGIGPSNPKTGQTSVGGALSKPAYAHANMSAVTKSALDPLAHNKIKVSPNQSFKHPGNKNHKDRFSISVSVNAVNCEIRTFSNSNNTFSDIRMELSHDNLSQPTKRKSTDSHNASLETRIGNNNSRSGFRIMFDSSFSSNKMRENSPHVNNKRFVFPKIFASVCVGGDSPGPAVSSKKKYVDELNLDDGLWEETVDLTTDVNFSELSNELDSTGKTSKHGSVKSLDKMSAVLNTLPTGLADHRSDGISPEKKNSPKRKPFQACAHSSVKTYMTTNEIKNGIGAVKGSKSGDLSFHVGTRPGIDNLGSQSSVSKSGAILFTGQGYKLETGEGGSSLLSEIRKSWQQKSSSTASTSGREPSHNSPSSRLFSLSHTDQVNASSSLPNNKRKSAEAFGVEEVNNSDSNKTVKIDKEMSSYNHSNIRQTPVSERFNEVNDIEAPSTHVKVPCPVCNVLVSENTINAHLDLCLLNS